MIILAEHHRIHFINDIVLTGPDRQKYEVLQLLSLSICMRENGNTTLPPWTNGPATKLETALSSQNKKLDVTLCADFPMKKKERRIFEGLTDFKGNVCNVGCAALTYLSLWIGPRVRKKLFN